MGREVKHVFRSGISWMLFGPVLALLLYFTYLGIVDEKYIASVLCFGSFLFIAQMIFFTRYIITLNDELVIQSGFIYFKKVKISEIKSIEYTNNPFSSPAASFKRLYITINKFDDVIISPKNRNQFVSIIKEINPNIEVKNN